MTAVPTEGAARTLPVALPLLPAVGWFVAAAMTDVSAVSRQYSDGSRQSAAAARLAALAAQLRGHVEQFHLGTAGR